MEKMAPHDVMAEIYVTANNFSEVFYSPVKQKDPVAGGLVYRSEGEFSRDRGWEEGYTYVFLGKDWKFRANGLYGTVEAAINNKLSNLTVQTMVVWIQADAARAQELIKQIDWERLKKLIKN